MLLCRPFFCWFSVRKDLGSWVSLKETTPNPLIVSSIRMSFLIRNRSSPLSPTNKSDVLGGTTRPHSELASAFARSLAPVTNISGGFRTVASSRGAFDGQAPSTSSLELRKRRAERLGPKRRRGEEPFCDGQGEIAVGQK